MNHHTLFIDGAMVPAHGRQTRELIDPANGDLIATASEADRDDVDAAVQAARQAFESPSWSEASARDRGHMLIEMAGLIRSQAAALAELETRNSGKPIAESEEDVEEAAHCFEYYGGLATKLHGEVPPAPGGALMLTLREPVGVAAQIIPWNYPLLMAAWKIAPALCAGCTVVLKPAEATPLTILALAPSFAQAGVPPGVVNIVTGSGATAGAALVTHPGVDKIAFTGSPAVGRSIMRSAADSLKRVTLELGGKSPAIFFADADFDAAVEAALLGVFANQGEVCSAGSRILVQRPIYRAFLEAMIERARAIRLGPGIDRRSTMGPLVTQQHMERVLGYQELGKREAKLGLGGSRATGGELAQGFFVEPTVFYDVDNASRIAREEIFGPVACVMPFDRDEDAVALANDTWSGLAAAVWTRDIFRALRTARTLKTGVVWINDTQTSTVEGPWGGYKQSGIGRELGRWGAEAYLETKQIFINLDEGKFSRS